MRVVFFNHWHNGDIHVSRGFIRKIMEKLHSVDPQITFTYSHKNDPSLLKDIPNLGFDPNGIYQIGTHDSAAKKEDTLYINTWYAQQNYRYMNIYGISFDTLYAAFDDTCKNVWGFSLSDISPDPSVFFPSIDYTKFEIEHAKIWLDTHPGKKIFVCNSYALSSQSHNFSITPLIMGLAKKHTDKIFILSNKEGENLLSNVFWSSDIIKKPSCDLNENSFLSEHCDAIIGRATGAFAFSLTSNNVMKRNCKFLCFTNILPPSNGKFWLSSILQDKINYTADMIITNESNTEVIRDLIEAQL
jgi:hypothetical protein